MAHSFDWRSLKRLPINRFIYGYVFIISALAINFLQLLNFLLVRPFSKSLAVKVNLQLAFSLQANLTFLIQWWSPCTYDLYVDSDEDFKRIGTESAYCVMNHYYDIDWLFTGSFFQFFGLLGHEKVVVKSSLKYVPLLGWSWFFSDYVFLKREWNSDRQVISREIKNILEYPPEHKCCVFILCEGTRFSKAKHAESMKVAREKGLPELKHHLLPRNKGFYMIATQLAGKFEYLYDMNMALRGKSSDAKPNLVDILNGEPLHCQLYVRRIPISKIPIDDERKCSDFLNKLYQEKDEIIDVYHRTGNFDPLPSVKKTSMKRNPYHLINTIAWTALILISTLTYLINAMLAYSWTFRIFILFMIFFVYFAVEWLVGQTDSKNTASKFGLEKSSSSPSKSSSDSKKSE